MNDQSHSKALGQDVALPETRVDYKSIAISDRANGATMLMPRNFGEIVAFSELMARADCAVRKHFRQNPGACMAVTLQAMRWQMDPFQVANKSYFVSDQLAFEGQLIAAVVITQAPIAEEPDYTYEGAGAELTCTVSIKMKSGKTLVYKSPMFKDITTKNSPLWKSDPQQQLGYYSIRSWARRHTPHIILGAYDRDEIVEATPMRTVNEPDRSQGERLSARLAASAPAANAEGFKDGVVADSLACDDAKTVSGSAAVDEAAADQDPRPMEDQLLSFAREMALDGRRAFDVWFGRLNSSATEYLKPHMASLMQAANLVQHSSTNEAAKIIEHDAEASASNHVEGSAADREDEGLPAQTGEASPAAVSFDFDAELESFTGLSGTFKTLDEMDAFARALQNDTASWFCLAPENIRDEARERFADAYEDLKKAIASDKAKADRAAAKAAKEAEKLAQAATVAPNAETAAPAVALAQPEPVNIDPKLAVLIAAGDEAAANGVRKLKFWKGRLNQKEFDALADRMAKWDAAAKKADEDL
jgi:hypothetical protein